MCTIPPHLPPGPHRKLIALTDFVLFKHVCISGIHCVHACGGQGPTSGVILGNLSQLL